MKILNYQEPQIRGQLDIAYPLIASMEHVDFTNYLYSNFIQLISFSKDDIRMNFMGGFDMELAIFKRFNMIEGEIFDRFVDTSFCDMLKEQIDNEYYAIINLDDFYITEKSCYYLNHFTHINFIYGYDENNSLFYTAGYDLEGQFRTMQQPYENIKNGYQNSENHEIFFLKPNEQHSYEFSRDKVKTMLLDYLNPEAIKQKATSDFNYLKDYLYLIQQENISFGIEAEYNIIRCLKECLEQPNKNNIIDYRAFHTVLEHKKMMSDRILFLYHNKYIPNDAFHTLYEKSLKHIDIAQRNKNLFIKYVQTKRGEILEKLIVSFQELFADEIPLYQELANLL